MRGRHIEIRMFVDGAVDQEMPGENLAENALPLAARPRDCAALAAPTDSSGTRKTASSIAKG